MQAALVAAYGSGRPPAMVALLASRRLPPLVPRPDVSHPPQRALISSGPVSAGRSAQRCCCAASRALFGAETATNASHQGCLRSGSY